jgi:hypothetical protein
MTEQDFKDFGIHYFTPAEVRATGANLHDVQPRLLQHADRFRRAIEQPVHLIKNGLTSGFHKSQLHSMGLALDGYVQDFQPMDVLKCALEANFRGVGLYCRASRGWVSFHLDLRQDIGFWVGAKKKGCRHWEYTSLVAPFEAYLRSV